MCPRSDHRPPHEEGRPVKEKTFRELEALLYDPKYSINPDQSLKKLNEIIARPFPIKHITLPTITEQEARMAIRKLKQQLGKEQAEQAPKSKHVEKPNKKEE